MDRFVIASVLSVAATGYHSGPFDLAARFSILSLAKPAVSVPRLVLLQHGLGIKGAALAWMARCIVELAVRLAIAPRIFPVLPPALPALAPTAATLASIAIVLTSTLVRTERAQLTASLRGVAPARWRGGSR